jgi:hypothetical protein
MRNSKNWLIPVSGIASLMGAGVLLAFPALAQMESNSDLNSEPLTPEAVLESETAEPMQEPAVDPLEDSAEIEAVEPATTEPDPSTIDLAEPVDTVESESPEPVEAAESVESVESTESDAVESDSLTPDPLEPDAVESDTLESSTLESGTLESDTLESSTLESDAIDAVDAETKTENIEAVEADIMPTETMPTEAMPPEVMPPETLDNSAPSESLEPTAPEADSSVSTQELEQFASVIPELQSIELAAQQEVDTVIEESNLTPQRFGELYQIQQDSGDLASTATPAEQSAFEDVTSQIDTIEAQVLSRQDEAIRAEGLEPERFAEILAAIQANPSLMQQIRQMMEPSTP